MTTRAPRTLSELFELWDRDAATLERRGDPRGAALLRQCAVEGRAAVEQAGAELLTLKEAALVSGFSAERLRHLVAEGHIPNAGRKHAPRVRRADLPMRAGRSMSTTSPAGGYDPAADAIALVRKSGT